MSTTQIVVTAIFLGLLAVVALVPRIRRRNTQPADPYLHRWVGLFGITAEPPMLISLNEMKKRVEKMPKYADRHAQLRSTHNWLLRTNHGRTGGPITSGPIFTPDGIVWVFVNDHHTEMELAHDGNIHTRRWKKPYHRSYLPRLAKQFSKDIIQ